MEKIITYQILDQKIDDLKSLRDKCEKNYRKRTTKHGNSYTVHSPRWNKINKALNKAYHCRREQIKTTMYTIANELYKQYHVVIMGDYVPSNDTAPLDNMKRSMLNQEVIGSFRKILKWVAEKKNKHFFLADERDTTKTCCVCGHKEKKAPSVRVFTCVSCKTTLMRDNNASVNIAKKEQFFLQETYFSKLSTFTRAGYVPVGQKCVIKNF